MHRLPPDIKMIAIDIDGTLLTPQRTIAATTKAAIHQAQEEGIVVTLATGRRYTNTATLAAELGLEIPLVVCDGALIMQHPQDKVLLTQPMHADVAQQAVDTMVRYGIQPVVHHICGTKEEIWTGPLECDSEWLTNYFAAFPQQIRRMPTETLCVGQPDPLRVVAFAEQEMIYTLSAEISVLACSWNAIKRGNYGSAELAVYAPHCSKASGVAALARQLGIALAEVMAIGDDNNDIEMLRAVGWSVAMGNANEAVKSSAHVITASNSQDGVALAIERYALHRATRP